MQVKIKIAFTYKSKHFFVLVYNLKQDKINIELFNTHSIIFKLNNLKVKFQKNLTDLSSLALPRSFGRVIFHLVFDSRSLFFAPKVPKPHGNAACYVGQMDLEGYRKAIIQPCLHCFEAITERNQQSVANLRSCPILAALIYSLYTLACILFTKKNKDRASSQIKSSLPAIFSFGKKLFFRSLTNPSNMCELRLNRENISPHSNNSREILAVFVFFKLCFLALM